MEEIKDELLHSFEKRSVAPLILKYIFLVSIIVGLGVYIGWLLFGPNSVEALYELNVRQKNLKRSIEYFKHENAKLQKEYFELKELEPEE